MTPPTEHSEERPDTERAGDRERPQHGDLWLRKSDGKVVGVLMVCGTGGETTVSGHVYPDGSFARTFEQFLDEYLLIGVDPEQRAEAERELEGLREALATDRDKWNFKTLMVVADGLLADLYPEGVPLVSEGDDPGPRLVRAVRDCRAALNQGGPDAT